MGKQTRYFLTVGVIILLVILSDFIFGAKVSFLEGVNVESAALAILIGSIVIGILTKNDDGGGKQIY